MAIRAYADTGEITVPLIHPLLLKRAQTMQQEFSQLESKIAGGSYDAETNRKFSTVSGILEHLDRYNKDIATIEGLQEIQDPELMDDVQQELESILPNLMRSTTILQNKLLPPIKHADLPCILELRPGVGGSEAALFTADLANMYLNFANQMRWKHQVLSKHESSSGFVNEFILSVDEPGAYNRLRHESGIHRVQRIPATESKGRIHTSTAAVVVLPKFSDGDEKSLAADERSFKPGEVRVDTMRAGGKGGQHVNTTDSAVRLVHLPTGIMVMQQDERSQPRNKAKAFSILRARLAALERDKEVAEQKKLRTDQVSSTDRSDKIRTYNVPQNRVTDHRCNYSVHDVDGCMQGYRLGEIIDKVEEGEFEDRLQELIGHVGGGI
ncbi:release factor [Yamadazyma tenuis ATCC 10573]|uniref:Peptide chain release factor 1, mitochondrial n=1 Tax=Candida tenuis (strain ATCC 10573 / BCRC 21748 / CBS 615 / JCM 9827 / NBRC 10315 / NRRL Y-1498 / VKM Y-70) TaxID=590646 RepID=G3B6P2_CANTC|nr:release factor [Yamadazyma tenuis ATCC 10573]EGV62981.1 release factor [Yamadazyma tenuis ATCC 10573]